LELPLETVVELGENGTVAIIRGTFEVTALTGADQFLALTGEVSVTGGIWSATVDPSVYESIEESTVYEFDVRVQVPSDAAKGESSVHLITLRLSNVRVDQEFTSLTTVRLAGSSGEGEMDDAPFLVRSEDIPWGIVIFIVGLVFLLALGIVWAVRNLEMVREVGGSRRIMLREKESGRLIKGRKGPRHQ